MTRLPKLRLYLSMLICALPLTLQAAIIGASTAQNIAVVTQPTTSGTPMTMLKLNQRFYVVGKSADNRWLKITVPQPGGSQITGWVMRSSVKLVGQTTTPVPAPQTYAQPYVAPTPPPAVPMYTPPPPSYTNAPPPANSTKPYNSGYSGSSSSGFYGEWINKKLQVGTNIGYLMYDHRVSTRGTTPGQLFSYRVSGLGIGLDIDYTFLELMNKNLVLGADVGFVYGLYSTKTGLKDTANPPQTFSTVTSKSTSNQLDFKLTAAYKLPFGSGDDKPLAGVSLGYQRLQFNGDDIETQADKVTNITTTPDGTNDALGMYISHTTTGILPGLFGSIPMGKMRIDAGLDFLMFSSYSESPGNGVKTGDSADPKIGFLPFLRFKYALSDHHLLKLGYDFRFQSVGFTGNGQRVTNNITDGVTKTLMHQLSLGYNYAF